MIVYENREGEIYFSKRKTLKCNPHLHREIEFCYILEGETTVWADEKNYKAEAGDIVLFFPNQIHSFSDDKNIKAILFILPPDNFHYFSGVFREYKLSCPVITPKNKGEVERAFKRAYSLTDSLSASPFNIEAFYSYLSVALSETFSALPPEKAERNGLTSLQKLLLYCDTHYSEPISLSILEKKLGLNRCYISHVFYDKLKIGFSDYINGLRINAAKSMLKRTEMGITDIAFEAGFSSIRTFNRQFQAVTGSTPMEYRKRYVTEIKN